MKIRNLLLGSIALAGLSTTGAHAADLGVLTSLDVCDALGLSGLTISSDTNCLQITGEVKYKLTWGDYSPGLLVATGQGNVNFIEGDDEQQLAVALRRLGQVRCHRQLRLWSGQGRHQGEAGPATACRMTVSLTSILDVGIRDIAIVGSSDTDGVIFDEAYVSIGDSTVIMAGKKGSIMNKGNDEPLNFLGLFNSEKVDLGVSWGPFTDNDSDPNTAFRPRWATVAM